jgi:hypothetical protein
MTDAPLNPYKVAHLATTEPAAREAAAKVAGAWFLGREAFEASVVAVSVPKSTDSDVATVTLATALGQAELRFLPSLALATDSRVGPLQARVGLGLLALVVGLGGVGALYESYTHRHAWFSTYGTGPLALGLGLAGSIALSFATLGFLRASKARTPASSWLPLVVALAGLTGEGLALHLGRPSSEEAKAALARGDKARAIAEAGAVLATRGHDPVVDGVLDALKLAEVQQAREVLLKVRRFEGPWYSARVKGKAKDDIAAMTVSEANVMVDKRKGDALRDLKFIVKPIDENLADQVANLRLELLVKECFERGDFLCAATALRHEEPDGDPSVRGAVRAGIVKTVSAEIDAQMRRATTVSDLSERREARSRAYHGADLIYRLTGDDKAYPLSKLLADFEAAEAAEVAGPQAAKAAKAP